jgi:hypothetical protein
VGGELVVAGDKLVGSAQLREGGALLQHGSLLLDGDQHLVTDLALGPAQLTRSRSLAEVLRRPVSFDEAACAVTEAARTWRAGWRLFQEEEAVLGAATAHAARFSDPRLDLEPLSPLHAADRIPILQHGARRACTPSSLSRWHPRTSMRRFPPFALSLVLAVLPRPAAGAGPRARRPGDRDGRGCAAARAHAHHDGRGDSRQRAAVPAPRAVRRHESRRQGGGA